MSIFAADSFMTALCCWREARSQGNEGMLAVANVINNRVIKHHSSPYLEVIAKWQFSSITAPGDPELALWPLFGDAAWEQAQTITDSVLSGKATDNTGGATLYYNPYSILRTGNTITLLDGTVVPLPKNWDASKLKQTAIIGTGKNIHVFFVEF